MAAFEEDQFKGRFQALIGGVGAAGELAFAANNDTDGNWTHLAAEVDLTIPGPGIFITPAAPVASIYNFKGGFGYS